MKGKQSAKKHRVYYLGLVIMLGWLVLPVFVKNILYRGMDLFQAPVQSAAAKLGEVQDYWALRLNSKNQMIAKSREVSRELARARMEIIRMQSVNHYIDRLEKLLSLEPVRDYHPEYARIIRRDVNAWFEVILLDKGRRHGVLQGAAVVSQDGLVGRVSDVSELHCTVTLLSSPAFRVTVNTPNDDRPIAFSGKGQRIWDPLVAQVQHVPQDIFASPEHPIPLYTSGLGEGLPEGIYVGDLISMEPELEGLFQKGQVRLLDSLRSLREVAILIPLKQGNYDNY